MTSNNHENLTNRIVRILDDDSSIPMLLIEGQWGSGKTFFAKNKLIPDIEKSGTIVRYFSVYGVDSITDFRDKFLSLSYTKHTETGNTVSPIINAVSEITGNIGDNGGVIASVINGLGNVVKKVAINKITDITLVLDDLERIPDEELRTNILGECFEYAENKKIKVIVICNVDKIDNKDVFEKVFSERLKYTISEDEQISIAFNDLSDNEKGHIKQLLTKNNHENLRTLIKSAKKFKTIIDSHPFDEETTNILLAREFLIKNIIALCIGYYEKKLTIDEIINKFSGNHFFTHNEDEQDDFDKMIRTQPQPPIDLIRFCCGMELSENDIDFEDYFPKKKNGMETLIEFRMFLLSDAEFNTSFKQLTTYLFDTSEEIKTVHEWFNALNIYIYLNTHDFLEHDESEEQIIEKAEHYIAKKLSFLPMEQDDSYKIRLSSHGIKTLYQSFATANSDKKEQNIVQEIKDTFERSWREVSFTMNQHYKCTPFLNSLDSDFIWNSIQTWSLHDICAFDNFIKERYRASNIWDYLESEKPVLTNLENKLHSEVDKMPKGLLKGYCKELSDTITTLVATF